MMKPATLRLVLLVSCAHGLVHVYEHSIASVEQLLLADDSLFDSVQGDRKTVEEDRKPISGLLGQSLRLPFGLFALLAGWAADRFGAKRLLLIYLIGASVGCGLAWYSPNLGFMFLAMFVLGVFASIYHPAGVGLISHHTTPENRPMALGYHGIFGSAGIACGPFLAGIVLNSGASWRQYYLLLTVPGLLLALLLAWRLSHEINGLEADKAGTDTDPHGEDAAHWPSYFVLMTVSALSGFVYAAILNFMPRYLDGVGFDVSGIPDEALRNYLTGGVLLLGVIGQYTAGRIARPSTLEPLMATAFFAATPFIFWMGYAQGMWRLVAAGLFAPLFFMHQPLFNSLVAKYVPRRRRSLCYGLSFTMGFGVGSLGPTFSGFAESPQFNYTVLACVLTGSASLALLLWRWNRPLVA